MALRDVDKCGARRRDGGDCCQPAMKNGRCRMHGGKTPRGLASPKTRSGRYSKDLPTRILARYQEAMQDPELLSVKHDVALLHSLIHDRLATWAADAAGPDWD